MKKLTLLKSLFLLCALIVGSTNAWAQAPVNTVLWAEDFSGYSNKTVPSGEISNSHTGTTVYGSGNVTYACANGGTTTQVYVDTSGPHTDASNANLLISKTNGTFTVSGIPTGDATELTLSYEMSGQGTLSVTTSTDGVTISGSTITTNGASTITLIFENTHSSKNLRIDDISLIVKTAGSSTSKTATTTTISATGITNTDLKNGPAAGSLSASVTVTEGGATVSGATIKWSSDDEDVAKVNETSGVVTLVGVGSATITASYEGDDTYAESSDTYELTVTDTRIATVTTIDAAGITNIDLKNGTAAGTLTASVTAGGDPVLGATVTWESSDPTVATITDGGVVTLAKVGSTTITASYAGGGSYAASSNTYELTVTDSRQPVSVSITNWNTLFNTTYNGSIADNAWPDASKSLSGEINNVSVTYAKADGSYGYLKDAEMRLYDGNTLSFKAPTNYIITKIVFTGTIADDKKPDVDVGTYTNSTKTWEGCATDIVFTGTANYAKPTSATITLARKLEVAFEDGWMSYVTPCNIEFPENVEAYVVTSIESGITGEKIDEAPEGTPVILHATDGIGVYALTVPETTPSALTTNKLKYSDSSFTITDDNYKKIYVLTVVGDKAGFGPLKKGNTLAAGKAYIEYATAQARDFFAFDSETTGIAKVAVEATDNIDANAPMYNLAGQRVNKSYKGVVIVNGKKMLNK